MGTLSVTGEREPAGMSEGRPEDMEAQGWACRAQVTDVWE